MTSLVPTLAVLAAVPVQAQAVPSMYEQALTARQAGHPAQAAALLERWLTDKPADVDARLHHGYALLDLGRLRAAEQAFRRVLETAPAYHDARIGLARIAQRQGRASRAQAVLAPVPAGNVEAEVLRRQLAQTFQARWKLDVGASRTSVGRGRSPWNEWSGQLSFDANDRTSVLGRVEATRRFGLHDIYGEAQLSRRFTSATTGYVSVGAAAAADYRPKLQLGAGGTVRMRSGPEASVLEVDLRYASFRSGNVATVSFGVEQYVLQGRAWGTARLVTLVGNGSIHAGALGRFDVQATPAVRLFAGTAHAPDTSEGVVTRVFSLFGGGEARLGQRHSLRVSLARTVQKAGASRMDASLGLGVRF